MDAYGIRHALLVGPNSGYGLDNRCLLDAHRARAGPLQGHRRGAQRHRARRAAAPARGRRHRPGLQRHAARRRSLRAHRAAAARMLADLDMLLSLQVEHDQLLALALAGRRQRRAHADRPLRPARSRRAASSSPGSRPCWRWPAMAAPPSSCRAARSSLRCRRRTKTRGRSSMPARRLHARRLPVGVGLAVPQRARSGWTSARCCGRSSACCPTPPTAAPCSGTRRDAGSVSDSPRSGAQ